MKFLFTLAFLFLQLKSVSSQAIVEFRYDRSGNILMQDSVRISPLAQNAEEDNVKGLQTASDGYYTVSVGPSPTSGPLMVKTNYGGAYDMDMTNVLKTAAGQAFRYSLSGPVCDVNVSGCPSGIYQLAFSMKDDNGSMHRLGLKIIKR